MVLPFDSYPESRYKQPSYTAVEEGYGYPQTGYRYDTPVGYNSDSYNQCQQLPMGVKDDYSYNHNLRYGRPHDHDHNHNQGYKHGHPHGYKHGHPHGHNYDHNHSHKYEHQNQHHGSAGHMGFVGNQCPPMDLGYGPSHATGHGMYCKVYTAFKEADD